MQASSKTTYIYNVQTLKSDLVHIKLLTMWSEEPNLGCCPVEVVAGEYATFWDKNLRCKLQHEVDP